MSQQTRAGHDIIDPILILDNDSTQLLPTIDDPIVVFDNDSTQLLSINEDPTKSFPIAMTAIYTVDDQVVPPSEPIPSLQKVSFEMQNKQNDI